ncbi:MAG: hypothetical protein KDE08_07290 [Rhodobacteraceae bacterium]|nr:hypothetical protein [Paracoccaceae bacterium]
MLCARLVIAFCAVCLTSLTALPASANCRIHRETGKCINVRPDQISRPDYAVGDIFPVYEHNMLLNIDRYGLKPVDGTWRYYRSGSDIYKVDALTFEVLEIIRNARLR